MSACPRDTTPLDAAAHVSAGHRAAGVSVCPREPRRPARVRVCPADTVAPRMPLCPRDTTGPGRPTGRPRDEPGRGEPGCVRGRNRAAAAVRVSLGPNEADSETASARHSLIGGTAVSRGHSATNEKARVFRGHNRVGAPATLISATARPATTRRGLRRTPPGMQRTVWETPVPRVTCYRRDATGRHCGDCVRGTQGAAGRRADAPRRTRTDRSSGIAPEWRPARERRRGRADCAPAAYTGQRAQALEPGPNSRKCPIYTEVRQPQCTPPNSAGDGNREGQWCAVARASPEAQFAPSGLQGWRRGASAIRQARG